jgi:prephenate dehydrogenase
MSLWTTAGAARIVVEAAEAHDARMPVISHLPQLASIALAATIRERGFYFSDLGTGGRDSTRLSASPFELWLDTLQRSQADAVSLLARLQWNVSRVREALATENWQLLEELWLEAAALHNSAEESTDGE